ncbi:MAG TPA: carboxylate-amine ligase [Actinomycetes bacterium]|jgi:carboxylate-amine ligase|nr:carboxylate-amine ligase [Actinomycetes bacterium]
MATAGRYDGEHGGHCRKGRRTPVPDFGFGIEEEHQILDPHTGELRSEIDQLLPLAQATLGDRAKPELYQAQVEVATGICRTLDQARAELVRLRRELLGAAERIGLRIGSAGTHPFSDWRGQLVTSRTRYQHLVSDYQQVAREQVLFGCHVHVGISDPETVIQAMNRSRAWLPAILALTANSPFWVGNDTGYASYRAQIWRRWPTAGIPPVLSGRAEYDALVRTLVGSGSIRDATKLYWDVRPSVRYPTLEFRIADACTTVDETLLVAGLCRALARTCCQEALRDEPPLLPSPMVLRASKWQAARFGLEAQLVDGRNGEVVPLPEMARRLLTYLRGALEEEGDWEQVCELVERVLADGNGAMRQRRALRSGGGFAAVVNAIATRTAT